MENNKPNMVGVDVNDDSNDYISNYAGWTKRETKMAIIFIVLALAGFAIFVFFLRKIV